MEMIQCPLCGQDAELNEDEELFLELHPAGPTGPTRPGLGSPMLGGKVPCLGSYMDLACARDVAAMQAAGVHRLPHP